MKHRKHDSAATEPVPPAPEPQGDGEPAPSDRPASTDPAATEAGEGALAPDVAGQVEGDGSADVPTDDRDAQLAEQREKYLRLAAEFDNYRKRTTRERLEAENRGQAELISSMLDVIDDLGRFAAVDPGTTDSGTLKQGVELVVQKFMKLLTGAGLEVINPLDEPFDPNHHEALTTQPALSPEDDGMVGQVYQLGYRFKGQLLRPARVVVKQWNG